jgi:hypothetical protein
VASNHIAAKHTSESVRDISRNRPFRRSSRNNIHQFGPDRASGAHGETFAKHRRKSCRLDRFSNRRNLVPRPSQGERHAIQVKHCPTRSYVTITRLPDTSGIQKEFRIAGKRRALAILHSKCPGPDEPATDWHLKDCRNMRVPEQAEFLRHRIEHRRSLGRVSNVPRVFDRNR